MSPDPSTRAPDVGVGGDAGTGATAAAPEDIKEQSQPRSGNGAPVTRAVTIEKRDERTPRHSTSATTARLGLIDYTLLALIAVGVAITVAMAIVNP